MESKARASACSRSSIRICANAENWFFGIQRDAAWHAVVEANYLGASGHHNSHFALMPVTLSTSNSIYHDGTIQVKRPFANGFRLQGAFT